MHLRGRQARKRDFAEAQRLISDRFLFGSEETAALSEMWQQIIDDESGYSSVVLSETARPVLAFGISVALKPGFLEHLMAYPQPFAATRIFEAWKRGNSPFMTGAEVAEANAGWGVDLFVLHHGYAPMNDGAAAYALTMALAAEFVRQHAGLNLRSMTQEFHERSWLDLNARFGFVLRHDFLDDPAAAHLPPSRRPFLAGIRRSEVFAPDRGDFPTNTLFTHFAAPRLGLDRELRKFLRDAIADESHHSEPDGDVRWDDIFGRISFVDPSVLAEMNGRLERRRSVIAWIRSRPEELQPYATLDGMRSE
jgi:hypothetical protein